MDVLANADRPQFWRGPPVQFAGRGSARGSSSLRVVDAVDAVDSRRWDGRY